MIVIGAFLGIGLRSHRNGQGTNISVPLGSQWGCKQFGILYFKSDNHLRNNHTIVFFFVVDTVIFTTY